MIGENFKRFRCGEPSAGFDGVVEGMSLDVLHHHVDRSVGSGTQVVNRNCVRMTKASRRLPFAPEPSQPLRVVSNLRRQHFYCHAIAEQDVPRPVNCAHAAFAQQRFHLVLPVEHGIDDRRRIGLEDLSVYRTEAHAVVVFCVAGGAVFHSGLSKLTSNGRVV